MELSSRTFIPAAVLAAFALTACGESGGWQGTVTDSAGVEIVTSSGDGLWADDEAWSVEQDLVIGAAEGAPEYQFGQIAGMDVDSDGRIYVYDQQAREVRVFDPAGEFVMAMGKPGAGPGELSQAAGPVFVTPGDTVVIPDMMQQRITLYTADGEPAGSHSLPMTGGIAIKWMELPDQDLIQQAMVMAFPGQEDVEQKNLLLRRDPTGALEDTVLEMPIGQSVTFSGNTPNITMFESEPMWTVGPAGTLYTGINSEYSVNVFSPGGELARIVRRPFEPRPITDSDQTEIRRIVQGLWQDQGMPAQAMEMMSQALGFADFYPAYANLLGGPDGSLWVQRIQTPDEMRERGEAFNIQDLGSATWDIFNEQGQFLGSMEMPPRFTPLVFIRGDLYGVLRDELDVQYATRLSVDRGAVPAGEE